MEKLKELPMGVIIAVGVAILALAGFIIFRSAASQNTTVTEPMDRTRYMDEMKKRASSGGYSSNGQGPGGRGPGAAGAGGAGGAPNSMQQRMMGNYSSGGGMQGGGR